MPIALKYILDIIHQCAVDEFNQVRSDCTNELRRPLIRFNKIIIFCNFSLSKISYLNLLLFNKMLSFVYFEMNTACK